MQEAAVDKAGIGRSYIDGVELGEHNVAVMNLLKIADALGMKLSEVLTSRDF